MLNITTLRRTRNKTIEVNMAPLIDMVFILLIFFLVTTSFVKETGVDINRPAAATAVSKTNAAILIGVTRENRIFIDKREIDVQTVRANVERAIAENPESSVVIVADRESMTGRVIRVLDECKLAGASSVSLAAGPREGN